MKRLDSIALMKFIATLAIWNHLAAPFYGKYSYLATGGGVGCSIFFYVSGFTLALGRMGRFDVWYKRRLSRVWPTCIAAALLYGLVGQDFRGSVVFALKGAGWFVSCILLYYAVYYILRKLIGNSWRHFLMALCGVVLWWGYLLLSGNESAVMPFSDGSFKYAFYYLFFMLGVIDSKSCAVMRKSPIRDMLLTFMMLLTFYAISFLAPRLHLRIFSPFALLPLAMFVKFLYRTCSNCEKLNVIVVFIGGLSLEMYLVGAYGASFAPLGFGPLSYAIGFIFALVTACSVRLVGRFIAQTLAKNEGYDWHAILKPL